MVVILIVFGIFLAFSIYSSHFRNPYKLTFIFGKKGSGKSCLMVHEMLKYQKKGWNIYTDIADCKIPGVRIIDLKHLESCVPDNHSLVCLDEAGLSMDNRNFKTFPEGLRDFFALQRKYKCKVIMNSQSYDVDIKVRSRVDDMVLQSNIGNVISVSRPIIRRITLTEPSADRDSRIADSLKFAPIWKWKFYWMPKYFKYFESFAAPARRPIPFSEIKREVVDLGSKNVLKVFRRADRVEIEQNKK